MEHATFEFEQNVSTDDEEYLKRLSLLIAPGSSEIIDDMKEVVSGWRAEAEKLKITRSEMELMAPAFMPEP